MNNEKENENKKSKAVLDVVITLLVVIALIVLYFFCGCGLDQIFTIVAAILIVAGSIVIFRQNKKIKEAYEN